LAPEPEGQEERESCWSYTAREPAPRPPTAGGALDFSILTPEDFLKLPRPLPPEPTYGPIPEQGQPPRSSQHRKGHQPRQKQTRTMKGKGGSAPVSQHASPVREERRSPIISSAPSSAQRMVTRSMRARQTQPARSHLRSRVVSRNGSIRVYSFSSTDRNRQHHEHHLQHSRHLSKSRLPRRNGRAEGL